MLTHEVHNQSDPLIGFNLYEIDRPLKELMARHDISEWSASISQYGNLMGSPDYIYKGIIANREAPVFHSHDQKGYRVDEVEFHPYYHDLMSVAIGQGMHAMPYAGKINSHIARLALSYLHSQNEAGTGCPLTMTFSCVPAIEHYFPYADQWLPKILSRVYDPSNRPYYEKEGLTIGMAMTEKQGGTDVRANTTTAEPIARRGRGEPYLLTGHKWFCSAPMCDAFLTLAQTEKGLSCFLFPRWRPDGQRNDFRIQRLKNKLGNKSNASSEIEFDGAFAWLMGEEGRGVPVIIEMVALTRYDCMLGSSALMRRGLTEVMHHITQRKVGGQYLIDQHLMKTVIADLCIESEAALYMTYRTALCLEKDEDEQLLLRLLTPIGKYWITKRANVFLAEAMECLGGNGYVEDSILPRLYREAPVNAIWEGSGNVQCLDVIRAMSKSPKVIEIFIAELFSAKGVNNHYDQFITSLIEELNLKAVDEYNARMITGKMAMAIQAAQLIKYSTSIMAEAYCETRLQDTNGFLFGSILWKDKYEEIIDRYRIDF